MRHGPEPDDDERAGEGAAEGVPPTQPLRGRLGLRRRLPANVAEAWPVLDLEGRHRVLAVVVESIAIRSVVRGRACDRCRRCGPTQGQMDVKPWLWPCLLEPK